MHPESLEIIANARTARARGEITEQQLLDVYKMVADWEAEKSVLG